MGWAAPLCPLIGVWQPGWGLGQAHLAPVRHRFTPQVKPRFTVPHPPTDGKDLEDKREGVLQVEYVSSPEIGSKKKYHESSLRSSIGKE